jgi:hypothetical protein
MERIVSHCAGWAFDMKNYGEPGDDIMGHDWVNREGLPAAGSLKRVLVVRPAILMDGECIAERDNAGNTTGQKKEVYCVRETDISGWTVSQKDVAHFVVDAVPRRWDQFENKCVNIMY